MGVVVKKLTPLQRWRTVCADQSWNEHTKRELLEMWMFADENGEDFATSAEEIAFEENLT